MRRVIQWEQVAATAYGVGGIATFVYLTFFDDVVYNWWNWILIIPINLFLAHIWPIYWLFLRPIFE
ncbi:hypothetical protein BXY53_0801 [Dichotomicrobium thermohalophilum]|uniref:Uncharacterized protein n=2 Tax=Dichotomicrobium thermohalophilum TaxID=933063 RepID=A0A397Q7E3_9HYPH|nr:hypothetical protein BXY53_0801 [Dichotomicrobium thermohalophilum]